MPTPADDEPRLFDDEPTDQPAPHATPGSPTAPDDHPGGDDTGGGDSGGDAERPAPVRLRLEVAYDGAPFRGVALNAGVRTVAGDLGGALARLLDHPVELVVAGRTDAGVHARANVVHVDTGAAVDLPRLQRSLNRMLRPSIAVRSIEVAPAGFDARHSAIRRTYRYTVWNDPVPDPLLTPMAWHVAEPLDLALLRLGCDPLIGEHDFTSFCRRPQRVDGAEASLVRRVLAADWTDLGDGRLRFEVSANAFCHQMVRSIVGTLVDVGRGRLHAGDVLGILRARDRHAAGQIAPPHGLVLWSVAYD